MLHHTLYIPVYPLRVLAKPPEYLPWVGASHSCRQLGGHLFTPWVDESRVAHLLGEGDLTGVWLGWHNMKPVVSVSDRQYYVQVIVCMYVNHFESLRL